MDSSFLQKKIGPLPFWAWAGILFVGVYLYRRYQSGTTTTSSTGTASTGVAPPTETITTAGGTYTGPVNAAPSSITSPGNVSGDTTSPGSTGQAAFVPPTGETLAAGGGYYVPGSSAPIAGYGGGQYAPVMTANQALQVTNTGGSLYVQPQPGVFAALPSSAIPAATPVYSQLPGA